MLARCSCPARNGCVRGTAAHSLSNLDMDVYACSPCIELEEGAGLQAGRATRLHTSSPEAAQISNGHRTDLYSTGLICINSAPTA